METEAVRADLLTIVKQHKREEYPRIIRERAAFPYLYHLSAIRENLISGLPVTNGMRVLERNAEYGALTGRLLVMAGQVVSVAEDEAGAALIRARYPDAKGRLTVITEREWAGRGRGSFGESAVGNGAGTGTGAHADGFDRILIAGCTFRYVRELKELRELLTPDGSLILADANRLGLKYLAGCQEEYRGGYFTGVEGYPADHVPEGDGPKGAGTKVARRDAGAGEPRCYTRNEYVRMLAEAGFAKPRFSYPYPDHKFPSAIYSDDWLPKKGELMEHRRNFDRDRLLLFDEGRAWDTITDEGLFGECSNSFLIEAGKRKEQEAKRTIYAKYSNERTARFAIRTDIVQDETGRKRVYKYAQYGEADAHIARIAEAYERLTEAYAGSEAVPGETADSAIRFCPCRLHARQNGAARPGDSAAPHGRAEFPFLSGRSLQELLEEAAGRGDRKQVEQILNEYIRRVGNAGGEIPFRVTEEFCGVFGEQTPAEGLPCAAASDIDLIFPNILLAEPGTAVLQDAENDRKTSVGRAIGGAWEVIDYEWTFLFPVPKEFLLYRALYFAFYQALCGYGWSLQELYALAGITEEAAAVYARMEEHFQDYIRTGALPVRSMQRIMGTRATPLSELLQKGAGADDVVPESEWIRARRIQYHIDREERQDGSIICSGWAFARTWDGRTLPAVITVVDKSGRRIPAEVSRRERPDVAEALKLRRVSSPRFGFDCVWPAAEPAGAKIRFSMGKRETYHVIAL